MSRISGYLPDRPSWVYLGLTSFTVALGMQLARAMLALEVWVLRDRMHFYCTCLLSCDYRSH